MAIPLHAKENAFSIIRKVDEMGKTKTNVAKMSMLTFPYSEDNSNYRDMKVLTYGQGEDDSYMEFISSKSIKGLRILSRDGDQWVYFPSTGRVRKIASKSKDKSVQGLGGGSMEEKYTFKILSSDKDSWTLEGVPINESAYSKIITTISKETYQAPKVEFYSEEDGHKKDLVVEEYKTISGVEVETRLEYYYQGSGAKSKADYNLLIVLSGERLVNARNYGFLFAEKPCGIFTNSVWRFSIISMTAAMRFCRATVIHRILILI